MNKKIISAKNKFKDLSIIFTDDFMPPKPHKFTAKPLQSGFNLDIFSLNNILSYYDIIILMVSNYLKIDLQWITILFNNLTLVGPILLIKGPALGKFLLILFRFIRIKILNFINNELARIPEGLWNKIKSMLIRLLKPKFTLLIIDCIKYGIYIGIKNFIANTYKDIILFNNININDLNIFLFCWGTIFMLSGIDCLVLLGHILLNFSTVISLWALTFYFMSNKEIKNFSPELHKWGELFLLGLFFIGLFFFLKWLCLFIILVYLKWKNFKEKLLNNIEDYILKVSSKQYNLRSGAKGSSGSNGPKKPEGPNNGISTDNPNKKRRHRDADVIEKNREVLRQTIAIKEGESIEKYERRIRDKEYKDRGPTGSYADKRRYMYNINPEYREKVLSSNRNHIVTVPELDRKRDWTREKMKKLKTLNESYNDVVLPDKSDPEYYTQLAWWLEKNEGKSLSAFVSFGKKVTKDTPDITKALIELRKEDPSLFVKKRPNTTIINDDFISGICRKGITNTEDNATSTLKRVAENIAARKAEAKAIAASKKKSQTRKK